VVLQTPSSRKWIMSVTGASSAQTPQNSGKFPSNGQYETTRNCATNRSTSKGDCSGQPTFREHDITKSRKSREASRESAPAALIKANGTHHNFYREWREEIRLPRLRLGTIQLRMENHQRPYSNATPMDRSTIGSDPGRQFKEVSRWLGFPSTQRAGGSQERGREY